MIVDLGGPLHEQAALHRLAVRLAIGTLAAVLAATLFPFELRLDELPLRLADGLSGVLFSKPSGPLDWAANFCLFAPLGWAAALAAATRDRAWRPARIVAGALLLSATIEALQVLLPTRSSHVFDVAANGLGAAVGVALQRRLHGRALLQAAMRLQRSLAQLRMPALAGAGAVWLAAGLAASAVLQHRTVPDNWDADFALMLGNEGTGDRPWEGRLAHLRVYDRALSDAEARLSTSSDAVMPLVPGALLASYALTDADGLADATGTLPALAWRGAPSPFDPRAGVPLASDAWLSTPRPVDGLAGDVARRGQLSVEVTALAADLLQTGPARLVTVSRDPWASNFTLGQDGDALVVRLRTPHTGPSGTEPPLVAPGVFTERRPVHLMVTYDGADLLVYVDGRRHPRALALSPGSALAALVPPIRPEWIVGDAVAFQALVFLPLGLVLALLRTRVSWWAFAAGIVLPAVVQEAILQGVSGRSPSPASLLCALAMLSFPPSLAGWRR